MLSRTKEYNKYAGRGQRGCCSLVRDRCNRWETSRYSNPPLLNSHLYRTAGFCAHLSYTKWLVAAHICTACPKWRVNVCLFHAAQALFTEKDTPQAPIPPILWLCMHLPNYTKLHLMPAHALLAALNHQATKCHSSSFARNTNRPAEPRECFRLPPVQPAHSQTCRYSSAGGGPVQDSMPVSSAQERVRWPTSPVWARWVLRRYLCMIMVARVVPVGLFWPLPRSSNDETFLFAHESTVIQNRSCFLSS